MQQGTIRPEDLWRFRVDGEDISRKDLTLPEALEVAAGCEKGTVAAQRTGHCVQLEFNNTHAAVLYMGADKVILRPYIPSRSHQSQDVTPFFCNGCGILIGSLDEYLTRFFNRDAGIRLFVSVVSNVELPAHFPGTPAEPESEIQWIPLTKPDHA
jgi:hypothetical protein